MFAENKHVGWMKHGVARWLRRDLIFITNFTNCKFLKFLKIIIEINDDVNYERPQAYL